MYRRHWKPLHNHFFFFFFFSNKVQSFLYHPLVDTRVSSLIVSPPLSPCSYKNSIPRSDSFLCFLSSLFLHEPLFSAARSDVRRRGGFSWWTVTWTQHPRKNKDARAENRKRIFSIFFLFLSKPTEKEDQMPIKCQTRTQLSAIRTALVSLKFWQVTDMIYNRSNLKLISKTQSAD